MAQFLHSLGKALGTPLNALVRPETRLDDWISPEELERQKRQHDFYNRMPEFKPPNLDLNAMTPDDLMSYWWARQQGLPQEGL